MGKVRSLLVIMSFSFLFYLALTAGSGHIGAWSLEEIVLGVCISLVAAVISQNVLHSNYSVKMLHAKRWIRFFGYSLYWLKLLTLANIDVAIRIFTGDISPGIISVPTHQRTDFGKFMFANSITLTPGTLSLHLEEKGKGDLLVHCIDRKKTKPGDFDTISKRIRGILET